MKLFLDISLLIFLFIVLIFSLYIFVDRLILSDVGFANLFYLYINSLVLLLFIGLFISKLMLAFPNIFGTSTLGVLIFYHSSSFLIANFLFIFITYIVFGIDYFIKSKFKKIKLEIITCKFFTHKNMLKDKKFLRLSLVISYFISAIIILFPIPQFILSSFDYDNVKVINYISSELKTYQQVFAFTTIPILFSILKK